MISQKPERLFESGGPSLGENRSAGRRRSYDRRLDEILEAATQLMARVGYEKASMRGIAKAAGVSLAGLYHYVESKEKMLFLIQFRTFNSLVGGLREKLHGIADPVEQLRVLVRTHVGYFAANMAALKVCSHELDSLTGDAYKEADRLRREYYNIARRILDGILDSRAPAGTLDRHVAVMSLFGMLNWLYRWYSPQRGASPTAMANQIASQFLGGVLATNGEPPPRTD